MGARVVSRRVTRRGKAGGKAGRPDFGSGALPVGPRRPRERPHGPLVLADDVVLKLSCDTFTCTKVEILKWKEQPTPASVTGVTDPKGAAVAAGDPHRQQAVDGALAKTDKNDSPEKHWPKTYLYDTCPRGCKCPETAMKWGAPEDVDQEVQVPIDIGTAGTADVYTVTVKVKVTRKIGTAKCT